MTTGVLGRRTKPRHKTLHVANKIKEVDLKLAKGTLPCRGRVVDQHQAECCCLGPRVPFPRRLKKLMRKQEQDEQGTEDFCVGDGETVYTIYSILSYLAAAASASAALTGL
ncbi:uncharacterized protein LOC123261896 [Cotesia glomerata]|uniref:uncharacterized protein LOC123261896 n=1 Tax=Cotesia glomerata TaxID=32391 RepID=UPI001D00F3D5|nr:uncharacterized protein LOC123261896 [Cotesia glomerata]XP_044579698.1 uncharacterized protein LOC123261896 [Cotesia glomerata]